MDTTSAPAPVPSISSTAFHVLLATDGATKPGPGGIYTTIRRLLDDGLIEESDERPDPDLDDQRRRYYRLTGTGRAAVGAEARRLETLVRAASPWAFEADA